MSLDEFSRIEKFFKPLASGLPGALQLIDDAAEIEIPSDKNLVVTTDTIVEGIHFIGNETPASIAKKLLGMNLSDLAAKAADPYYYSLSIALPKKCDDSWLESFVYGLQEMQSQYGIKLAGGDSVSSPNATVLTASVSGFVDKSKGMIRRNGANVGDLLYVTGTIGDGFAGLKAAKGEINSRYLLDRYNHPKPRLEVQEILRAFATSAMDISDGLIADAQKLMRASCVTGVIDLFRVPLSNEIIRFVEDKKINLLEVVSGGDDYEILFTIRKNDEKKLEKFAKKCNCNITRIGKVVESTDQLVKLYDQDEREILIRNAGYIHK